MIEMNLNVWRLLKVSYFRRKLRLKLLLSLIVVKLFFMCLVFIIYKQFFTCLYSEVEEAVSIICQQYREGNALGNLCYDLCISQLLKPTDCQPHHFGKDVVFTAMWKETKIMLKASKLRAEQYDPIFWTDDSDGVMYPEVPAFYNMIEDSIKQNLNISCYNHRTDDLSKLWTMNISDLSSLSTDQRNTAMNNIWHLLQQTEYLFSKCLENINILPKILGSCGYIYGVQHVQPLQNFMLVLYPTWQENFKKRTEWAKLILKYLELLETLQFHKGLENLHICDLKIGHFGRDSNNNQIKLLDADMLFFESVLINNMKITKECFHHDDCSFIDCKGFCNSSIRQCSSLVMDTNLERVCRNIFSGHIMKHFGLLSSPPDSIAPQLQNLLEKCVNGNKEEDVMRQLLELLNNVQFE